MTEEKAVAETQKNRAKAIKLYRSAAKELFAMPPMSVTLDETADNCDELIAVFSKLIADIKNNRVAANPFNDDDIDKITTVLQLPIAINYDAYTQTSEKTKIQLQAIDDYCDETDRVEKLQRLISDYCFEAAKLAAEINSKTEDDFKAAYAIVINNCFHWVHGACNSEEATLVAQCLFKIHPKLVADIRFHINRLYDSIKREIYDVEGKLGSIIAKLEITENEYEVSTLLGYGVGDVIEPMASFISDAIDLELFEHDYSYDASNIGVLLKEIVKIRYQNDDMIARDLYDLVDTFMEEVNHCSTLHKGYLVEGVPESFFKIYTWFRRKVVTHFDDTKLVLAELDTLKRMSMEDRERLTTLTQTNAELLAETRKNHEEIDRLLHALLYVTSGHTHGRPLKGLDYEGMVRDAMVRRGVAFYRDDQAEDYMDAARQAMKLYFEFKGAYKEAEIETFRRAIERECKRQGINPKPRTPKTNPK